jgi:hypothetical protein
MPMPGVVQHHVLECCPGCLPLTRLRAAAPSGRCLHTPPRARRHAYAITRTQLHWENKHPKLPFDPAACEDLHAKTGGVTTQGVAVRGSTKK